MNMLLMAAVSFFALSFLISERDDIGSAFCALMGMICVAYLGIAAILYVIAAVMVYFA